MATGSQKNTPPALTVDNVMRYISSVSEERWEGLSGRLLDPRYSGGGPNTEEIKTHHTTLEARLQAMVKKWLEKNYRVSWRCLSYRLYQARELQLADNMLDVTEPPDDPTLTLDALTSVFRLVRGDIERVMRYFSPPSPWKRRLAHLPPQEQVTQCSLLLSRSYPYDSTWGMICYGLYNKGEYTALERARSVIPQDPTLTVESLTGVMALTTGQWRDQWRGNPFRDGVLGLPDGVINKIEGASSSRDERMSRCSQWYLDHVWNASWDKVSKVLYRKGEMAAAEKAKEYLTKDPTLTADRVGDILQRVNNRSLKQIAEYLDVPQDVRPSVCVDVATLAGHYTNISPYGSWTHLHKQLQRMGQDNLAEEVFEKYVQGTPPQISSPPCDQTRIVGDEVVFRVSASGEGTLSYQWRKDGKDITSNTHPHMAGIDSPTLYIAVVNSQYEGSYQCVVSNEHGSVESQRAKLEVVSLPQISTPPSDQTRMYGYEVEFKVAASGRGGLSYQWTKDGKDITPNTHPYVTGATTPQIRIKAVLTQYQGTYSCIISNKAGSVESPPAKLLVVSPVTSSFIDRSARKVAEPPKDLVPLGPPKREVIASGGRETAVVTGEDEGIKIKVPPQQDRDEGEIEVQIQTFTPFSTHHVQLPPKTKLVSPIYDVSVSSMLEGSEAEIQHYADFQNDEDISDMVVLHSSDVQPPYRFTPIEGGVFSKDSNVGTVQLKSFSHFTVGASAERPERYTLYFIHPFPMLTNDCMYAMFSASFDHDSFKKHLLAEMKEFCGESVRLRADTSIVSRADGSDGFELIPKSDPTKEGYSLFSASKDNFKVPMRDLVQRTPDDDPRDCSPPNIVICVEATDSDPTSNLICTFEVQGAAEDATFVLRVKAPPQKEPPSGTTTKLSEEDISHLIALLTPFAGHWKKIGAEIGFKSHELASIEGNTDHLSQPGAAGFLSAMLHKWPSVVKGTPTMEALEKALLAVNLVDVSKELRNDLQNSKEGKRVKDRSPQPKQVVSKTSLSSDLEPQQDLGQQDYSATAIWNLTAVHNELNGDKMVIAVLDTGINIEHDAFRVADRDFERIKVAKCVEKDGEKVDLAPGSHGSMAAFIAAGDAFGTIPGGVAPKATLLICQIGEEKSYSMPAVIKALELLKKLRQKGEDKLHVVSMSFGIPHNEHDPDQKKICQLIEDLRELNVVCIAACGNYGRYQNVLFPACLDSVISVGALDVYGHSRKSNPPKGVDVYAPGEGVPAPSKDLPQHVVYSSGSSCATPAVAGLTALTIQYSNKHVPESERSQYRDVAYLRDVLFRTEMKDGDEDHQDLLKPEKFFKEKLGLLAKPSQSQPTVTQQTQPSVVAPNISAHPTDQTKVGGDSVRFSVTAQGRGTLSYQWSKDGKDITPEMSPTFTGATTPTLTISSVLPEYEGSYKCVVSNEAGSVGSESAQLEVGMKSTPPAISTPLLLMMVFIAVVAVFIALVMAYK